MARCKLHKKNGYPNQRTAIRQAIKWSGVRGTPLRVYFDPSCKSYHLTKKESWH